MSEKTEPLQWVKKYEIEKARADKAEAERDLANQLYEECRAVNESVAVCASHTSEITNAEGLHNDCYRCEVEKQESSAERLAEALRMARPYVEEYACGKPHPDLDTIDATLAGAEEGKK